LRGRPIQLNVACAFEIIEVEAHQLGAADPLHDAVSAITSSVDLAVDSRRGIEAGLIPMR
jgi:hypothetical protein